jgi:FlaA1/EpsC-like NDP-sugar epimerase
MSVCPATAATSDPSFLNVTRGPGGRAGFRVLAPSMAWAVLFVAVLGAAYAIRFEGAPPPALIAAAWSILPAVVALKLATFLSLGVHRGWRALATFADAVAVARAATLATVLLAIVAAIGPDRLAIPRSVLVIDWAGTLLAVCGLRAGSRLVCERRSLSARRRALIVGDAVEAETLARAIHHQPALGMRIVGFLDPDGAARGRTVGGITVLGTPGELDRHAARLGADRALIASGTLSGAEVRQVVDAGRAAGVRVQVLPPIDALVRGDLAIRPRDVDLDDLLGRPPVRLDGLVVRRFLRGKVVLVTGAAGSIGSEIARQARALGPSRLVLLDHSENGLFFLERALREVPGPTEIVPCLAGIGDTRRLRALLERERPDVVLHAAAHKHVPLMETHPGEAVKNNVLGTRTLLDEVIRAGAEAFVMISTDKAVRPSSVMGACKRLAEMVVQASAESCPTRLITVRFGNVLGSNGSVVPIFQEQIRRGGPLTVTHPEMTRYFMTIPEAARLVLQAGAQGRGGEILVLDMGEPVRVVDLARDLIRLSGLEPDRSIEIAFTGLRPGEKLHEELYDPAEEPLPTAHPKIHRARSRPVAHGRLRSALDRLAPLVDGPGDAVVAALADLVPEYRPRQLAVAFPITPAALPETVVLTA